MDASFAKGKEKWVLNPGIVAENCPSHTAEEWLEILRAKSNDLGRPISWMEIKTDPKLDHHAISQLLGPYSFYENKLLPGAKKVYRHEIRLGSRRSGYLPEF